MSLTRQTATGKNYLTRSDTNADASELVNALHMYQKFAGSDGVGNITFTVNQAFIAGSHTLWVFLNGTKVEEVDSSPSGVTQYIEVGNTQFQFGAAVSSGDLVEAMIVGGPYDTTPGQIEMTSLPVGMIFPVLNQDSPPSGTLECDGSSISQTTYSALYSGNYLSIGTYYNPTPTGGEFNLPDMRGRFLRHADHGASRDPNDAARTPDEVGGPTGDVVGSIQDDDFESHDHGPAGGTVFMSMPGATELEPYASPTGQNYDTFSSTGTTGGDETRPKNINVMWCIKY